MKEYTATVIEAGRITEGEYGSERNSGPDGAYIVPGPEGSMLKIIASTADDPVTQGFEHVSVSAPGRTPTWTEMQWVKDLFWYEDEVCFQLHPAKRKYVNCHPYCLHIWRHKQFAPPLPPLVLVGPLEGGNQ